MSKKTKKFWLSKLGIDIIIGILVAIFTTGVIFIISHNIMDNVFYKYLKNSQFVQNEADMMMASFKEYVNNNNIRTTNKQMINYWVEENNITVLSIHDYEAKVFESRKQIYKDDFGKDDLDPNKGKIDDKYYYRSQDVVKFADKESMVIMINDYTNGIRQIARWAVNSICIIIFLLLLFKSLEKHISYINRLESEVMIVQNGSLEYPITISENNEITSLAKSIEEMRLSFIEKLESENEARKSNDNLITAMSHDLRTPLTTLMAYLDILYMKKYKNEEEAYEYIKRARDKSYQIKNLSDKLFEYFLAFNNMDEEKIEMSKYNGNMLIEQILMESICLLEEDNMNVNLKNTCNKQFNINVNIDYIRRVFDNIFSNIRKYSPKDKDIIIKFYQEYDNACIEFYNFCIKETKEIESNKIGLKSSKKLMENMGGTLEYIEKYDMFITKIKVPITN